MLAVKAFPDHTPEAVADPYRAHRYRLERVHYYLLIGSLLDNGCPAVEPPPRESAIGHEIPEVLEPFHHQSGIRVIEVSCEATEDCIRHSIRPARSIDIQLGQDLAHIPQSDFSIQGDLDLRWPVFTFLRVFS